MPYLPSRKKSETTRATSSSSKMSSGKSSADIHRKSECSGLNRMSSVLRTTVSKYTRYFGYGSEMVFVAKGLIETTAKPVSSRTSRTKAASHDSPLSNRPPGNAQVFDPIRSSINTRPSPFRISAYCPIFANR